MMPEGPHLDRLREAIAVEGRAHAALLAGDHDGSAGMLEAAALYRASWALAPPASYGRLVGFLKATIIGGGDVAAAAADVQAEIPDPATSPPAHYALAVAAVALGQDDAVPAHTAVMRNGSPAFGRAADALDALAARDAAAYATAVQQIVEDFAGRDDHLTGIAIADTALMLERLAADRGLAAAPASPLLPG